MSATGLEVFDTTLQKTNLWLEDVMEELGPDRKTAWRALGAVLRTVRDRIPLELAAHFGAQLPLLIRGSFYDQWRPSEQPEDWKSLDVFRSRILSELHDIGPVNPDDAARSVFQTVNHYMEPNQVAHVREALPEPVRNIWPDNKSEL